MLPLSAAEIKLYAERRLGELLAETVRHEGGRPEKLSHAGTVLPAGINRNQSSRWQAIARVPEETFVRHIEETTSMSRV